MVKIIFLGCKLLTLSIVVILLSLIPVKGRRICDHIQDLTMRPAIQGPIHFVSKRVDFASHYPKHAKKKGADSKAISSNPNSEATTTQEGVSALLKSSP